jgi:malonate decarboxylase gamma subunit
MTLDELVASLFPTGHTIQRGPFNTLRGTASRGADGDIALIGITDGAPVGIDNALILAEHVLSIIGGGAAMPILVLVDASIQNMTRRDELLGLNEYFGHLYKVLALAAVRGHRTIALLYGAAAGGSLIATALPTQAFVTLPDANPSVMDLPSMARVTKLPLGQLEELAKATPIFAPGAPNYFLTGAVWEQWDCNKPLADKLAALLRQPGNLRDRRDEIGLERKGRLEAASIAQRVAAEAAAHVRG